MNTSLYSFFTFRLPEFQVAGFVLVIIFTSEMSPKDTKLSLNDDDLALLNNRTLIDSKRSALSHIVDLLGDAESRFHELITLYGHLLPPEMVNRHGKISRGENYRGYPWVVLDHPAIFGKSDFMAFRTLFWWGDSFSLIFQAGGQYFADYGSMAFISSLIQKYPEVLVCIGDSPWEHHYEKDNYTTISSDFNLSAFHSHCEQKNFIKIAFRFPLNQLNDLNALLAERMEEILKLWASGANNLP